jgi:uncharacterized protein
LAIVSARGGVFPRSALLIVLASVTFSTGVLAQPAPPVLTGPVNDFAKVIDPESGREIERRVLALQKASGDIVVVATVPTFQPYGDIKEYAVKMFENAGKGIGERAKDNGLLIVVAVDDRKVAIEVGYGLEPFVTDGFSGQTIRESMLPSFRAGRYGEGLLAGTTRLINRIAEQRGVTLQDVPADAPIERPEPVTIDYRSALFLLIAILVMIAIISRTSRRRRRHWGGRPWSGWDSGIGPFGGGLGRFGGGFGGFGGGRGGSGGFGGGRSGGGGATGGW